ncbi:MAG: hypothetical protein COA78_11650 [Blastopirellula sp.]|nr:MAG: hypothetical protein COA78_11650 [Blastopirellula sp.]
MAKSTSNLRNKPQSQPLWFKILLGLSGTFVLLLFLMMVSGANCGWSGEQLSLDGFRQRRYSATRIPGLDIQVSNSNFSDSTGSLARYISGKGWISPEKIKQTDKDWIPVTDRKGSRHWEGDAKILTSYLDMSDSSGAIDLLQWSKDNQELAAILWPEVEQAGRVDHFYLIPDMIHLMLEFSQKEKKSKSVKKSAREKDAKFRQSMAKRLLYPHLRRTYTDLADAYQASGETEKAKLMREQAERTEKMETPLDKEPTYSVEIEEEEEPSDVTVKDFSR